MEYQIEITPLAIELLSKVKDKREQQGLRKRIEQLKSQPDKQGKALSGGLKGYRSIRALGQRYRIVYRVDKEKIIVVIVGAGIRKEGDQKDIFLRDALVSTQQSIKICCGQGIKSSKRD